MGNYLKNGGRLKGCKLEVHFDDENRTFKAGSQIVGVVNIAVNKPIEAFCLQATLELRD